MQKKKTGWTFSDQADLFMYTPDLKLHQPGKPGNVIAEQPIMKEIVEMGRLQLVRNIPIDPIRDIAESLIGKVFRKHSKPKAGESVERWPRKRANNEVTYTEKGLWKAEHRRPHENSRRMYLAFTSLVRCGYNLEHIKKLAIFLRNKRKENKRGYLEKETIEAFLNGLNINSTLFQLDFDLAVSKIIKAYNDASYSFGTSYTFYLWKQKSGLLKTERAFANRDAHIERIVKQG